MKHNWCKLATFSS